MQSLIKIPDKYHRYYYIFALSSIAAFMHSARYLAGTASFCLALNWVLEGGIKNKFRLITAKNSLLIFLLIYLVHVSGLANTADFEFAFKDLRVKLPLFVFPIIIASSPKFTLKEIKIIFYIFILSIFIKSVFGIYWLYTEQITETWQTAGKFSHIRYSLLINIAVFSSLFFTIYENVEKNIYLKNTLIIISVWLVIFLFILKSLTGIVVFIVVLPVFTLFFLKKNSNSKIKILITAFLAIFFIFLGTYIYFSVKKYYITDQVNFSELPVFTANGNKYLHNIKSKNRENGHYVDLNVCLPELEKEWNKRSEIKFDSTDYLNQKIKRTLIRYLSSKNLTKDSAGISKLNSKDILNIEKGYTNYIFVNKYSLYNKIYVALWEAEDYKNGGNPQNHSITQRIEFLRISLKIIEENFWTGVGTGDLKIEFAKAYEKHSSKLGKKYRLRAHNQFVTFFIAFGFMGFSVIMFSFFGSGVIENRYKNLLFVIIFLIMSLSMFNEDTLETQLGAQMFALFVSVTLFACDETTFLNE